MRSPLVGAGHVAICGASATGKTALALALAKRLGDVELVSVDSMSVYRRMDIGTAKPSRGERAAAPWHLLDLVEPWEEFSVGQFQVAASEAIAGIESRGHRAVLVGGTGLYHRAVVDSLEIPGRWPAVAAALEVEVAAPAGLAGLHARLHELDAVAAGRIEPGNRRRLVRALEVTLGSGRPFSSYGSGLVDYPPTPFLLIGLGLDRVETRRRLEARLDAQLEAGFLEEVRALATHPEGISRTARQALGYRELLAHLEQGLPYAAARAETLVRTRVFTKRQEAWFHRDPRLNWLPADGPGLVDSALAIVHGAGAAGAATPRRETRRVLRPARLTLEKLHGAGNDFLVVVDRDELWEIDAPLAAALCDRHRGVGADGILRALPPRAGGDLRMELRNADGSVAETSGNGIRCLVLAALAAGMVPTAAELAVETIAGTRRVMVGGASGDDPEISVEMGTVKLAADDAVVPAVGAIGRQRARHADVGNPHLVIAVDSLSAVSISAVGRPLDRAAPGGANVEVIAPAADGSIDLLVWERGVGPTLACGSGSCAAAAAARLWGLCGDEVAVANPGGSLSVRLSGDDPLAPLAVLGGPTRHVATVTVDVAILVGKVPA